MKHLLIGYIQEQWRLHLMGMIFIKNLRVLMNKWVVVSVCVMLVYLLGHRLICSILVGYGYFESRRFRSLVHLIGVNPGKNIHLTIFVKLIF